MTDHATTERRARAQAPPGAPAARDVLAGALRPYGRTWLEVIPDDAEGRHALKFQSTHFSRDQKRLGVCIRSWWIGGKLLYSFFEPEGYHTLQDLYSIVGALLEVATLPLGPYQRPNYWRLRMGKAPLCDPRVCIAFFVLAACCSRDHPALYARQSHLLQWYSETYRIAVPKEPGILETLVEDFLAEHPEHREWQQWAVTGLRRSLARVYPIYRVPYAWDPEAMTAEGLWDPAQTARILQESRPRLRGRPLPDRAAGAGAMRIWVVYEGGRELVWQPVALGRDHSTPYGCSGPVLREPRWLGGPDPVRQASWAARLERIVCQLQGAWPDLAARLAQQDRGANATPGARAPVPVVPRRHDCVRSTGKPDTHRMALRRAHEQQAVQQQIATLLEMRQQAQDARKVARAQRAERRAEAQQQARAAQRAMAESALARRRAHLVQRLEVRARRLEDPGSCGGA